MLTASQSFKLHGIVHRYFNKDEDAQAFVSELEAVIDKKYEVEKDRLATKDDIAKLQIEMREQKAEIIKWMFVFWASLLTAVVALIMLYIRK